MADINLESQSPVAMTAGDAAIVRRGTGGSATAELVELGTLATQSGTFSGTSSGTNTGDQTITLTGAVTGTGTGSFATSLGSFTKAQLDGAVSDGNVLYVGDVTSNATHTGDVTGATALTIAADAVTFAKMQNIATDSLIGRDTASTGDPEAITVTGGIEFSGSGSIRTSAFTGDATKTAGGTALTLATVNSNVGSFGSATQVATFTVNAKGLTTAAGNTSIAIPSTAVTDFAEAVDDRVSALVVAGTNMTITYNDGAGTLTFDATGGGAGTDLTYTAATRVIASSTGADATLPLVSSGDAGLAPASGGGTTNFLRADGTWAAPSGGGGGSPGGSTGEVQYNDAGAFAGAADVEIEGGQLRLPAISPPSTPAADGLKLFGRKVGGRMMPAFMGPSGLDSALNPHFGRNRISMWQATGNGGTDTNFGFLAGSTGTSTTESVATTNLHTYMRRRSWRVTTASTTAVCGFRGNATQYTLGGTAAGLGGFNLIVRWGPATGVSTATHRAFMGMRSSTAAPTDVNPSTLTNMCGMGYDAADTNIQFMHNDGSGTATKIDLGASFPKPSVDLTSVYEIAMFAPPGTTQSLSYEVTNLVSGAVATGTVTTDIPATTTLLNPWGMMSVGGTSSVIGIMVCGLYIETDY